MTALVIFVALLAPDCWLLTTDNCFSTSHGCVTYDSAKRPGFAVRLARKLPLRLLLIPIAGDAEAMAVTYGRDRRCGRFPTLW